MKYCSSSINTMGLKKPQKKFIDKRKPSHSIRHPREVEGRRDIDILFEDMTMNDLTQVVEKGSINAVIKSKQKKINTSEKHRFTKNKRIKVDEKQDFEEQSGEQKDDPLFEQKAISQALKFQKELQELRYMRASFARSSLKESLQRQSIGNNGYNRFLCTHYNPGSSFISSLNSISQKYERKIIEKKRLQKERWREFQKLSSENPEVAEKVSEKDENLQTEAGENKAGTIIDSKEESKKSDSSKIKKDKLQSQQTKSEKKGDKDTKKKRDNSPGQKKKVSSKSKERTKKKEQNKIPKSRENKSKVDRKSIEVDTSIEKVTEDLKDEVNIAELQKCVSMDNHNVMVDDILNQSNPRISSKNRLMSKTSSKSKKKEDKSSQNVKNSDEKVNHKSGKKDSVQKGAAKAKKERKPVKKSKPKEKKIKEPKPKKVKPEKPKIVKKIKPDRSKYQGRVIKKKLAPKKISQPSASCSTESSDKFNVVSCIESDEEKEKDNSEHTQANQPEKGTVEQRIIKVISSAEFGDDNDRMYEDK